jgi:hypothetical protein
MTLGELAAYVKEQLKFRSVQVYGDLEKRSFQSG